MQYNTLFDRLQNLIEFTPSVTDIAKIIDVPTRTLYTRGQRNSNFSSEEIAKIEEYYAIKLIGGGSADTVQIDFYPDVFGSCGSGLMVFDESSEKLSVTKDVITNYSPANKYSIISARGSSMSPIINDDDRLIIQHNVESQIIDDTVYLFRYNGELFIKRLVKNVDQVICISENPRFQDRIIEPKEDNFFIIGKVVGLFRSKV